MKVKHLTLTALCMALGVALPLAFHSIPNAGSIILPMHIPVLLCGLICGWPYGCACGVVTPLLSSLLTGMPPAVILPGMLCELAVYGLVTGLLLGFVHTKKPIVDIIVSLVCAMTAGRAVAGILNALIFRAGSYSLELWLTASFATALPGIIIQIIVIPILVQILYKVHVLDRMEIAFAAKPRRESA